MNRRFHTNGVAAALAHSAIGNRHSAFLSAGDPEFKAVEKEGKIQWLDRKTVNGRKRTQGAQCGKAATQSARQGERE